MKWNEIVAMMKMNNTEPVTFLQICLELHCPDLGAHMPPAYMCVNYRVCNPYYNPCVGKLDNLCECSDDCGDLILKEFKIENPLDFAVSAEDMLTDNCLQKVDLGNLLWHRIRHFNDIDKQKAILKKKVEDLEVAGLGGSHVIAAYYNNKYNYTVSYTHLTLPTICSV